MEANLHRLPTAMTTYADDELNRIASARVGRMMCDKYRIERLLGCGGMAAVYVARHRNGHRVALKFLHPWLAGDPHLRRRFLREGYAANAVEHEGALRVLDDAAAEDGSPFLVMELLSGVTVATWMERAGGVLPPRTALALAGAILDVLAAAHAKAIVHRDIKPDNLFVTDACTLKILDFGIARFRVETRASRATRAGSVLGTPGFMPPEQALGQQDRIDGQSDLWAVGATLFNMMTSTLVHDGPTPEAMMVAAATCPAPPLARVFPGVPPSVAEVVDQSLRSAKHERFADARAMKRAITHAFEASFREPMPTTFPHRIAGPLAYTVVVPENDDLAARVSAPASSASALAVTQRRRRAPPPMPRWAKASMVIAAASLVAVLGLVKISRPARAEPRAETAVAVAPPAAPVVEEPAKPAAIHVATPSATASVGPVPKPTRSRGRAAKPALPARPAPAAVASAAPPVEDHFENP